MYRIPKDQIPCKFSHEYFDLVPTPFGSGNCRMPGWDCLWFEKEPENPILEQAIEAYMDKPNFKCTPNCPGYQPVKTTICKKHDEEYLIGEECGACMQEDCARYEILRDNARGGERCHI